MDKIGFHRVGNELYDDSICTVRELVDNETGVHYLVFADKYHEGVSMTPRLNADGTVMVETKETN